MGFLSYFADIVFGSGAANDISTGWNNTFSSTPTYRAPKPAPKPVYNKPSYSPYVSAPKPAPANPVYGPVNMPTNNWQGSINYNPSPVKNTPLWGGNETFNRSFSSIFSSPDDDYKPQTTQQKAYDMVVNVGEGHTVVNAIKSTTSSTALDTAKKVVTGGGVGELVNGIRKMITGEVISTAAETLVGSGIPGLVASTVGKAMYGDYQYNSALDTLQQGGFGDIPAVSRALTQRTIDDAETAGIKNFDFSPISMTSHFNLTPSTV